MLIGLMPIASSILFVKASFVLSTNTPEKKIISSWFEKSKQQLVMIVFSSSWSGSTHILRTYLGALIEEFPQVHKVFVDVEKQEELATEFGITKIPTTVIMKEGEVSDTLIGTVSKKKLRALIESHL